MEVILRCPDLLQQAMSDLTAEVLHYPAWMEVMAKIALHSKKQVLTYLCSRRFTYDYAWYKSIHDFLLRITAM